MTWNAKYTIAAGDPFKNNDFNFTEEYFEMLRLWNGLNRSQDFDLAMEVMSGNPEAIRLWELFTIANDVHIGELTKNKRAKGSKKGPHRYSEVDKLKALRDWDELDRNINPITLREFLEQRFGTNGGILRVAESTFHGWRQQLKKNRKY